MPAGSRSAAQSAGGRKKDEIWDLVKNVEKVITKGGKATSEKRWVHRNLELCKTLKTTTEQFSLFSTEQFGGRRIKSGTRGKPPRRVRVTATRAWAQLAGVRASKMLPYIISLMPLVRSQPVSRAAASLGPKGPAVLRRRCRQYRRAPRNSWQHVS